MEMLSKLYDSLLYQTCFNMGDGEFGGGLVVAALRPSFKRLNSSLRRGGSHRNHRRPTSLSLPSDVVPKCEQKDNERGPTAWALSFEKLLEDPIGLQAFTEFLKKEFSAENIDFWTACERYHHLPEGPDRLAEAQRIFEQHLCPGAPEPVNVDAHGRQSTEQNLQNAPQDLFQLAQKQIFNLMKFDSYPRFLKSDLYKQHVSTGGDDKSPNATPSKLKKSLSNAEDRRRKSLLPWHRKNRSKSKDRGESEYCKKQGDYGDQVPNEIHSSRSSLTSLDLAVVTQTQDQAKKEDTNTSRTALCRVILSNGNTTVVQIKEAETIQQLVQRLLDKRGLAYSSFEVYTDKHPKALEITESSSKLAGCEVNVEQRVVFKMDLPNRKVISVKSKYTKIIKDVLRPILHRYNYNLDQVSVTGRGGDFIDISQPVTTIDGNRLNVQLCDDKVSNCSARLNSNPVVKITCVKNTKLDEITNQVFEGILQEKAETVNFIKAKSDKGSIKSEDWGSEHSSGIFGRFLRRDSGIHDKKKKSQIPKLRQQNHNVTLNNMEDPLDDSDTQMKKPLIAKWKAGVNKLQVAPSNDPEEVSETRTHPRLADLKSTEKSFDFVDVTSNPKKPPRRINEFNCSRIDLSKSEAKNLKLDVQNYENRDVTVESAASYQGVQNIRIYSTVEQLNENKNEAKTEPPPLPPKPKIIPLKPPNWGQNGFYKGRELGNKQLFLEQPSSSFV